MAGYVFAIGGDEDPVSMIRECAEKGIYSTYLKGIAPLSFEGTLADYMSMKPGDNIYFFCKRRYYGIGELISVGPDCKYCNYPHASARVNVRYEDIADDLLVNFGEQSPHYRWLCTFKGSPYFFEEGIDTDEILTYKPNTFKMLRAFWKVSFIKLSDEENASLKEIFLLRRQRETATQAGIFPERNDIHNAIASQELERYFITPTDMLQTCTIGTRTKHEMALEAAYGDYEAIEACIIAAKYPEDIGAYYSEVVQRYYTLGSHPVRNKHWSNLKLLRYSYADGELSYTDVTPQNEIPD